MKVMCICPNGWQKFYGGPSEGPKYGDIDTVIETRTEGDITAYKLDRFTWYFMADEFIPISEISETEFERNYNKQLV